MMVQIYNIQDT